ncbi:MAG: type II toxin-antitoxin system VapC family toxin [Gemmatimonadota bacterium]
MGAGGGSAVKFWDASAIVPLVTAQSASPQVRELADDPGKMVVWWGTIVECQSGLARLRLEGKLSMEAENEARTELTRLSERWTEIVPVESVRLTACALVRRHPLRAGDALQLAAAIHWAGDAVVGRPFLTIDRRLYRAASLEGFAVLPRG